MEPTPSKERITKLSSMSTTLSRLTFRSDQRAIPLSKPLQGEKKFEWTREREEALDQSKTVIPGPITGETSYHYLAISVEAVSVVRVRKIGTNQNLVYSCSKTLKESKTHNQKVRKLTLSPAITAGKLERHFTKWE